jgi:plastocyanin
MLDPGGRRAYDLPVNVRAVASLVVLAGLLAAPAAIARSGLDSAVPAPEAPAPAAVSGSAIVLDTAAAPRATASRMTNVTIGDYFYDPDQITISPGATVLWTNEGTAKEGHTVTDKNGSFDSGILKNGDTYSHTFDTAGTFNLFCSVHPKMKQTVLVESPSSGGGGGGGTGGGGGYSGGAGNAPGGGGSGSGGGGSGSGGASGSGSGGGGATTSSGGGSGGGGGGGSSPTATGSSGSGDSQGGSGGGSLPMSGLDAWLLALIGLDLLLAGALIRTRLT